MKPFHSVELTMAGLLVMGWLGVGLCGHLRAGNGALTSRTERSVGDCDGAQLMNKLNNILLVLTSGGVPASIQQLLVVTTRLDAMAAEFAKVRDNEAGASTFVRWGKRTCSTNTQLVYVGHVGGSHYTHSGAAANALCLTGDPKFDSTNAPSTKTFIYGAEYEHFKDHHQQDVPCSVCRTPHPTALMIPGTNSCPSGWTVQYTGYLASGYHSHKAATEYLCLDKDMEADNGGSTNQNGKLFYYVVYQCGSLPCPPYVANKVALCAVCSK